MREPSISQKRAFAARGSDKLERGLCPKEGGHKAQAKRMDRKIRVIGAAEAEEPIAQSVENGDQKNRFGRCR